MSDLTTCVDVIVTQTGHDEVEVSLLGSRTPEADAEELRWRLRAWSHGAVLLPSDHPRARSKPDWFSAICATIARWKTG
jgi:hypothetical protein